MARHNRPTILFAPIPGAIKQCTADNCNADSYEEISAYGDDTLLEEENKQNSEQNKKAEEEVDTGSENVEQSSARYDTINGLLSVIFISYWVK